MYRLTRGAEKLPTPPVLDPAQRAVVEHAGGPLLVLAGPGTGKTTTLVECVVDRIERRNVDRRQHPGADILAEGRCRPADAHRGAVGPYHGGSDGDDLPCLLLRPGAPLCR